MLDMIAIAQLSAVVQEISRDITVVSKPVHDIARVCRVSEA